MKNAILIFGELRTFWYCADSIKNNLIIPNNADVFIIGCPYRHGRKPHPLNENNIKFDKTGGSYISRNNSLWLEYDEKDFFKNIFGTNLKKILFVSDIDNYYNKLDLLFNKKREHFDNNDNYQEGRQWYDKNGNKYDNSHPGPSKGVLEQYYLLHKTFELLENYEKEKNIKYDYIFRIRPDFYVNNIFNINRLFSNNEDIYIRNRPIINNKYYCSDYIFFGKRDIIEKIAHNFYKEYGLSLFPYDEYKKYNTKDTNSNNLNYVAETAFGLFLSKINCNKQILHELDCQHGFSENDININYNMVSLKFKINKVATYNIGINYNKLNKKTYIYTTQFNMPEYINIQYESLMKYFKNDFKYIVINDAKLTGDLTNFGQSNLCDKITNICKELNVDSIRFPQELHKNRIVLFPDTKEPNTENAVTRCADVVQFCIKHFTENYNDGYLMILDADMFFINNFDVNHFMNNYNVAGIKQRMGYLWNGILVFDSVLNLNKLNFDCGYVNNEPVDVGGQTYFFMEKYKEEIKYKPVTCSHYTFPNTYENLNNKLQSLLLKYSELRNDNSANKEIILNQCILHIRSGGNWDYRTKEFKYRELEIIQEYLK